MLKKYLHTNLRIYNLMHLRNWQQKVIDSYPSIVQAHRRFILKAPTGAGKTVLASEIVERFYKSKRTDYSKWYYVARNLYANYE